VKSRKFKIRLAPSAEEDLESLETDIALRVVKDIKKYLENPPIRFGKTRLKKLTSFAPPLFRLRSGDYRAYYRIIEGQVVILAITHKNDSEKILRSIR
jgi:mRNA-degrading endonuclease RelE of RelBE toxin-antitoxin system